MTKRPRNTKFFQASAAARLQELRAARHDGTIAPIWQRTLAAYERVLSYGRGRSYPMSFTDAEALLAESAHGCCASKPGNIDLTST